MNHSTRRFDRMFPGIAQEENRFTRDLLADGRLAAEANRRNRLNQNQEFIKDTTLEGLLNILCITKRYIDIHQTKYFYPESDENGNTIIDHENKRIKFIEKETGECIYRIFE